MKIKSILPALVVVYALFISGCGNNNKEKEETPDPNPDTTTVKVPETPAPETPVKKDPPSRKGPGDVLENINQYLVTTPAFDLSSSGEGITNASVTIHNKLNSASFQKIIMEVSILLADGKEFRTDYHTVVNLEPGGQKMVKIPNTTRGVKVTSRVVKVKSNELTNGESVTVGNGYIPK